MFDHEFTFGDTKTRVSVRLNSLSSAGQSLAAAIPSTKHVFIVTDERVATIYADVVERALAESGIEWHVATVPPGEPSKSLAAATRLYEFLSQHRAARDSLVFALGGGVVSDLAGFVAGTWMRGIPFAVCPTTLEAAVDACLGGKTAVNVSAGKNLVGVFHQPSLILVDPRCLNTLDARDIRAGLAESIKHALIADADFLAWHEGNVEGILALQPEMVRELILWNLRIKGAIVERDPCERSGERMLLNFGHTIGHAVERASDFSLRHGECVAIGMVAACRLGETLRISSDATTSRVVALLAQFGLPTTTPARLDSVRVLEAMRLDKKIASGSLRFVLLADIARPVIRADVPEAAVRDVMESLAHA